MQYVQYSMTFITCIMEEDTEILRSPSKKVDVRVLLSLFVSEHGGKTSAQVIHKEKFNKPRKQIAISKGLRQNPEVTVARVNK